MFAVPVPRTPGFLIPLYHADVGALRDPGHQRRTDVVGIFPNDASIVRLIGALLLEQNDEWQLQRRYLPQERLTAPGVQFLAAATGSNPRRRFQSD